jgi:nitroimidazol reductase NimA-like FMN-containing flavoprotein (pyridoxamine 5'-phosphate oxidase superfamily)
MQPTPLQATPRTAVRRSERGSYDRETAYAILDEALVAHVGFTGSDGQPFVIPMVYGRVDDTLYLHGAPGTRLLRTLADGAPLCVTVTLIDALVLAKSQMHHSANYRSVVVLGSARRVRGAEAARALTAIVDHALPGRSAEARPPDADELRRTAVLAVPIEEASVKVRTGGPVDDEADVALPVWAGIVPITTVREAPIPLSGRLRRVYR